MRKKSNLMRTRSLRSEPKLNSPRKMARMWISWPRKRLRFLFTYDSRQM